VFDVRRFELKSTHTKRANLVAAVLGGSAVVAMTALTSWRPAEPTSPPALVKQSTVTLGPTRVATTPPTTLAMSAAPS
jgi:hypothetical protein